MGLQVYNRLMEPITLLDEQLADFRSRTFEDLGEGFPFPEDLAPKYSQVISRVPFMTLVSCLCELLRSGGEFTLLRRLWGHFYSSLGERKPEFSLQWCRSETVVSSIFFCHFSVGIYFGSFSLFLRMGGGGVGNSLFCWRG